MILDYLMKYHFEDCVNILSAKDNLGYFSIKIDFLKLFETCPDVGDKVLCSPLESLPACNRDIIKVQQNILEHEQHKSLVEKLEYYYLKRNVHARFFGLPVCPELHRTVFPKNVDLGGFLKVTGTVVRVTQSKMLEYQRKYVCVKCKYENNIEAEFEYRYILKAPSRCANPDKCKSSTFTQVNLVSREHCKDYQEIKIQEQVNKLSIGTIPGSMWIVLEDDLVDGCKPGDDVNVCGTVRRRWRPSAHNKKSEVELVFQANYLEVCNSQKSDVIASAPDVKDCFNEYWAKFDACPLKGRDQILASVCPQVYGLHLVKLAVMLTVITGSDHSAVEADSGRKTSQEDMHVTRVRGQCHLLLVGDPGTGKSQLLRAGASLCARSVLASGAGSSKAGLTCAALREEGEWQLEAGALVLSDGGVCCIDEIGQLREHDRTAIHEAMEQQTISIAKAGIVCKLNTRCAVIAACNPKGRYETDQPLSANVALGTPLLSRFDLIFILLDSKNKAWDKLVSSYILFGGSNSTESKKQWSIEKLQMYIGLVGPRPTEITKSANVILQSYYMLQRKAEHRDPSRTTVRMLDGLVRYQQSANVILQSYYMLQRKSEHRGLSRTTVRMLDGLVRLSQAHCRLMYRTTILPMDAIVAVSLMDLSMQDCTLPDTADALHSTFQKYPDFDYLLTAKKLLTRLNLHTIWLQELLYYGKLLQVDHKTLEMDIDRGDPRLFAKFDDVTDENFPLSSSLVTSSYFNVNKVDYGNVLMKNDEDNFQGSKSNDKLAATLKKHATLNKEIKSPPVPKKQAKKRKRKEITIDTSSIIKKKQKSSVSKASNEDDNAPDSEEDFDNSTTNLLNAVPSVNDFFADLGIDFKFTESPQDTNHGCENKTEIVNKCSTQKETVLCEDSPNKSPGISRTGHNISGSENLNKSRTDRLKQFQFAEKRDFSKYEEKMDMLLSQKKEDNSSSCSKGRFFEKSKNSIAESSITDIVNKQIKHSESNSQISLFESSSNEEDLLQNDIVKLENSRNKTNSNEKSVKSSQLSMFDSSDCDIDLDI